MALNYRDNPVDTSGEVEDVSGKWAKLVYLLPLLDGGHEVKLTAAQFNELLARLTSIEAATRQGGVSSPVTKALVLSTADTQETFVLPANVRQYTFKVADDGSAVEGDARFAFIPDLVESTAIGIESDSAYTLPYGAEERQKDLNRDSPLTIYFASSTPGVKILIQYWV